MSVKLNKIINEIDGKIISEEIDIENIEVTGAYVSDLLSDVMGNAREGQVWITIMKHLNVIAVASLAGMPAVIFSKNIKVDPHVIKKAQQEDIVLVSSPLPTFEVTGIIYNLLK